MAGNYSSIPSRLPRRTTSAEMIGKRFGRLTVLAKSTRFRYWDCRCDCGTDTVVEISNLPRTKSCGCLLREVASRIGKAGAIHGATSRLVKSDLRGTYTSWTGMVQRCTNPKWRRYDRYGGRGISVSPEFSTFEGFLALVGKRPDGTTLDRIDNDGNYAPGNVRWASHAVQAANRSNRRTITYNGQSLPVTRWAKKLSINVSTLRNRLENGWTVERAFTTPIEQKFSGWRS